MKRLSTIICLLIFAVGYSQNSNSKKDTVEVATSQVDWNQFEIELQKACAEAVIKTDQQLENRFVELFKEADAAFEKAFPNYRDRFELEYHPQKIK